MPPNHVIIAGMAYGDEGKGSMVDYLCRVREAKLVVRYNGGPQAGHNVVTPDGLHHCFSQWGSGTLAGVPTYLSRFMMIEPYAMANEARVLDEACGITNPLDYLLVDEDCLVITPWHWLMNRFRECARGADRHGSCGMGIGELRSDELDGQHVVHARDLPFITSPILAEIQDRLLAEVNKIDFNPCRNPEAQEYLDRLSTEDPHKVAEFYRRFSSGMWIVPERVLLGRLNKETAIFEGAQGVLLDPRVDLKYSTWSDCTFHNALELLDDRRAQKLGVWRTYFTRHGRGPLRAEQPHWRSPVGEHNMDNAWQGPFRLASFDMDTAAQALDMVGGLDGVALSHCDCIPNEWRFIVNGEVRTEHGDNVPMAIEDILGPPIRYKSYGPTWSDKVACMGTPEFNAKLVAPGV